MKDKIIVASLSIILLIVFSAMVWDLYGRQLFTKNSLTPTPPTETSDITPVPSSKNNQVKNNSNKKSPQPQSTVASTSYRTCLENTKDERAAKDCCDCLSGDASVHKACRDAVVNYDFSKNTVFKTFDIPSTLGKNGDYSMCTASSNQQQCKQCCEASSTKLVCGDYQFCRTACNNLAQ